MRLRKHDVKCLQDARELIDKNYSRSLFIPDIAYEIGMSSTKLKDSFRELFGISLHAYIVKVRMGHARRQLEETDKPLQAIAIETGYKSSSSFIVAFRGHFGLTPGQFRRSM